MACLRCGSGTEGTWSELLHYCPGCVPRVQPPAPFLTEMAQGKMRRAGRWAEFPHEWFYRHDPRYNPALRIRWRKFAGPVHGRAPLPAWW